MKVSFSDRSLNIFLFFLLAVSASSSVSAEPIIWDRKMHIPYAGEYLEIAEDYNEHFSIEDVSDKAFSGKFRRVTQPIPAFGFDKIPRWIRVRIKNPEQFPIVFYTEIEWPYLPYVSLYIPAGSGFMSQINGSTIHRNQKVIGTRFTVFKAELPPQFDDYIYFKIKTYSSFQIPINFYSEYSFIHYMEKRETGNGLFFGLISGLILYNLFLYLSSKDTVHLYYIANTGGWLAGTLIITGYFMRYVKGYSSEFTSVYTVSALSIISVLNLMFLRRFFLPDGQNIKIKLMNIMIYSNAGFWLAGLVMHSHDLTLYLLVIVYSLYYIVSFGIAVSFYLEGNQSARFYVGGMLIFGAAIITDGLRIMGLIRSDVFTFYFPYLGYLAESAFFTLAIGDRYRMIRLKLDRIQTEFSEERLRISRDLHDSIGSELALLLSSEDSNEKKKTLENVMFRMKDLVFILNQDKNRFSLHDEIKDLILRISSLKKIRISFQYEFPDHKLSMKQKVHLLRISSEWLINIIKYADAGEIRILAKEKNSRFILFITDNGNGFRTEFRDSVTGNGSGLKNIRYRAGEIHARVRVFGIKGKGSVFALILRTDH